MSSEISMYFVNGSILLFPLLLTSVVFSEISDDDSIISVEFAILTTGDKMIKMTKLQWKFTWNDTRLAIILFVSLQMKGNVCSFNPFLFSNKPNEGNVFLAVLPDPHYEIDFIFSFSGSKANKDKKTLPLTNCHENAVGCTSKQWIRRRKASDPETRVCPMPLLGKDSSGCHTQFHLDLMPGDLVSSLRCLARSWDSCNTRNLMADVGFVCTFALGSLATSPYPVTSTSESLCMTWGHFTRCKENIRP